MSKIFISYRREDSEAQARLLFERFKARFGEDDIFWDLHTLQPGINYVDRIYSALDQSGVVLVIIGPHWLSAKNEKGIRRLELPDDLVRIEVAKSLQSKKHVIPVVVGGATFPQAGDLPRTLKDLAKQHGLPLRGGADFEHDVSAILHAVGEQTASSPVPAGLAPTEVLPDALATLEFTWSYPQGQNVITPPVCDVPAGSFLMGGETEPNEGPIHAVNVRAFTIAKYPVTVAEYRCFALATGKPPFDNDLMWDDQLANLDHPIVNVSWFNASEYAAWLSNLTGRKWRLPTEAEWEKAARWDRSVGSGISREYPWGPQFEASRCNTREGGLRDTSAIAAFSRGASALGVCDMAGNVWEWTNTIYTPVPYSLDGRDRSEAWEPKVRRGGSWDSHRSRARGAFRAFSNPEQSNRFIGFRLALGA